ncbi:MAG: hypothetical protein PHT07_05835 [Paludibacter sp.]|nr:hypothetical protein [Paludibacter sp.]
MRKIPGFRRFVFEKGLSFHAVFLPPGKSGYDFSWVNRWLEGVVLVAEKNKRNV